MVYLHGIYKWRNLSLLKFNWYVMHHLGAVIVVSSFLGPVKPALGSDLRDSASESFLVSTCLYWNDVNQALWIMKPLNHVCYAFGRQFIGVYFYYLKLKVFALKMPLKDNLEVGNLRNENTQKTWTMLIEWNLCNQLERSVYKCEQNAPLS